MRVLFTTRPEYGHFHPLVPLARALARAGHEVAFACPASFIPVVAATGFRAFPAGFDQRDTPVPELVDLLFPQVRAMPIAERVRWVAAHVIAGVFAQSMAPDLLRIGREWQPAVIVRDPFEYGGCVAAEALGIPHATVEIGASHTGDWEALGISDALDALRATYALPPDHERRMTFRYLHLSFVPPAYQDPAGLLPATTHALRPAVFDRSGDEGLPDWVATLPDRPTVYATLGTEWNRTPGVFEAILAAFAEESVNLIVSVGRNQDPARFGPQPAHVRIARYIPQSLLLSRCDLVVCHAGWNTVIATLAEGLPLVLLPLGADQHHHARRCAALGVGRVLGPEEQTPAAIRAAAREVLANPQYRQNAERVRAEAAALPGMEDAVALLERLAREQRPLLAG